MGLLLSTMLMFAQILDAYEASVHWNPTATAWEIFDFVSKRYQWSSTCEIQYHGRSALINAAFYVHSA
jgi:hypothetical protein